MRKKGGNMEKIGQIACKSRNIDNDNEVFCEKTTMTLTMKQIRVDRIADNAVEMLHAPQCRTFFCKCAQHLSENDIYSAIESAMKPSIRKPAHYAVRTLKTMLARYGY